MRTITGEFESGAAARKAVSRLHAAGVSEDDIAFLISGPAAGEPDGPISDAEHTGARIGAIAADIGRTAAELLPFVGRNLTHSPLGRALSDATETSGALAGRLLGAASEGGFAGSNPIATPGTRASVSVRATPDREPALASILSDSGAILVRTEG